MGNKNARARSATATAALTRFQTSTGLRDVEAKELAKVFEACSHGTAHVTREEFQTALGQLEAYGLAKFRNLPMGERLFDQFDVNKDGKVDLQEFMSGFLLLCKGSDDDKLDLTFRVFDKDGNGYISKEELLEMYTSTYHALMISMRQSVTPEEYRTNENARKFQDEVLVGIEQQFKKTMESVTESIWQHMDTNKDGLLSKEEFRAFVTGNPFVKATYNVKIANNAEAATPQGQASSLTAEVLLSFLTEEMDDAEIAQQGREKSKDEKKEEKKDDKSEERTLEKSGGKGSKKGSMSSSNSGDVDRAHKESGSHKTEDGGLDRSGKSRKEKEKEIEKSTRSSKKEKVSPEKKP